MDGRPIGMFDSGFGGISVLAEAARALPDEDFLFLGDNLHAPYGDRTPAEVLAFTRAGVCQLIDRGAKAIVIACNTATSAAAATLRAELPLPIVGMEPALKPASQLPGSGTVLVMATTMTLRQEKFLRLMERYGSDAIPVPSPGLVELVEAGETDGPRMQAFLTQLLHPYLQQPVKAVVLGCTHYLFVRRAIAALLPPPTALVDGNAGTVRQLKTLLVQRGLLAPARTGDREQVTFLSTSPDPAVPQRMRAWLASV